MNPQLIKKSQIYFIFSFVGLIILGTLLLKLPFITHQGGPLSWLDAWFTATSAVCVTGLTTVATSGFNLAGQIIILFLVQLGGLGIMTLTVSIIMLLAGRVSMNSQLMMSSVSDDFPIRGINQLIRTVVCYTFGIELIGMLALFIGFFFGVLNLPFGEALYSAWFHAVSAFCNAGFSTWDSSLIGTGYVVKMTVAFLIILGGLGVYVIYDLIHLRQNERMLRIHTRIVLWTSGILTFGGMFLIRWLEKAKGFTIPWVDAFFQSVTCRTAGFNTIEITGLHTSCLILMIVLMLIGASPGSTGGGMKTTTAALIFISVYNTIKGNRAVLLMKRQIPETNILKAFTIMFLFLLLLLIGASVMAFADNLRLQETVFEAASALGTVGLTVGVSGKAGASAKVVLIVLMFLGRVGPFTFFLFLLSKERKTKLKYPEERIILG
jgi:trk/ktr system potassium uptake protein